jgi:hypothetical protein
MAKTKSTTVPVNRRALIARLNRALEAQDQQLIISRGNNAKQAVGHFWLRDNKRNAVLRRDIDLEEFARKIGCLQEYEHFDDE